MKRMMMVAAALLIAGCASAPQKVAVKEVNVCSGDECDTSGHKYNAEQLLAGFHQLLKANEGQKVTVCDSDPKTRACESVGVCHLVIGGFIPGNGCVESIVFSEVATGTELGQISLKADMARTWIWTPVKCSVADGTLSVRSANEISIDFPAHYCNWMVIAPMRATFNVAVESLDLVRGQIGGYWNYAEVGAGNGKGSGYLLLKFPKGMPEGKNWIGGKTAAPLPIAHLPRTEP